MCLQTKLQDGETNLLYSSYFSLLLISFIVLSSNHRHMHVVDAWDSILRAESSVHMLHGCAWRPKTG